MVDLRMTNVRNLQQVNLQPSPGINFIVGDNGSGKSSVLEAITLLSRGKSFRSTKVSEIINFSQSSLIVTTELRNQNNTSNKLGVEFSKNKRELRLNGEKAYKISELAYQLPTQFFDPGCYNLLDAEPKRRRQFIDWGTFHHDLIFLDAWKRYKKALIHRNRLLKSGHLQTIDVWDQKLAEYGGIITQVRVDYLQALNPLFACLIQRFQICSHFELRLMQGWNPEYTLIEVLQQSRQSDIRYGYTQFGPHKCDLMVMADDRAAKSFLSRGQKKILVLALMLAQIDLMTQIHQIPACVLVDDITAELDRTNQDEFMRLLGNNNHQLFVTTTDKNFVERFRHDDVKVFEISAGVIHSA
ncbi:MAG TPA: DNA replication/repair protein RecF [Crenotrichaceae bacterium]|nr:DNA replication/repair protein RecF [Crenotrichaceae bacterium]